MATVRVSSRNPFRSIASTPSATGATVAQINATGPGQPTTNPPPTFTPSVTAPAEAQAQNTQPMSAADLDVEEPPPYSVHPSATTGETLIEQGPRRPFQPAPSTGSSSFSSPGTPRTRPAQTHHRTPSATSEFARDFYAAGDSEPPGHQVPHNGRPTTSPVVGHPLLRDGKILVYSKRHECDKCWNIGYKSSDPQRPCKRCWHKYAKPYTRPIAYSFSNTTRDSNFQRPLLSLPRPPPPPPPLPRAVYSPSSSPPSSPSQPYLARGGWMADPHDGNDGRGGFYSSPTNARPMGFGRPPPGAIVYTAGDPRIGGTLCWRCEGRGNTSFFILDRVTCEVCAGIGRVF